LPASGTSAAAFVAGGGLFYSPSMPFCTYRITDMRGHIHVMPRFALSPHHASPYCWCNPRKLAGLFVHRGRIRQAKQTA